MLTVALIVLMTAFTSSTTAVTYLPPVVPDGAHAFAIAKRDENAWLVRYDLAKHELALWAPLPKWSNQLVVSADGRHAVTSNGEREGILWELGATEATRRGTVSLWDPSVPEGDGLGELTPAQLVAGGTRLVARNDSGGTRWIATLGAGKTRWERQDDGLIAVSEDGRTCVVHGAPPTLGACGLDAERRALPQQEGSEIRTGYSPLVDPRFAGEVLLYDVSLGDAGLDELTAWSVSGKRPLWTHASSRSAPEFYPQPDGTVWVRSARAEVANDPISLRELEPKRGAARRSVEVGELRFGAVAVIDGVLYATAESTLFPVSRWDLAKGERLPDRPAPGVLPPGR